MQARDAKKGAIVLHQNEMHMVTEATHRTPGNLRAFFQITLKNLKNGRIVQTRFAPDEPLERITEDLFKLYHLLSCYRHYRLRVHRQHFALYAL